MNRIKMGFVIVGILLASCSSHHPEYIGEYYLYYKDGNVLSERDSVNQVYIRLQGDHTFKIRDWQGVESGWWKTIDYDDFSITYFYPTYLQYLFRLKAVGETIVRYAPYDENTKIFFGTHWYEKGTMADFTSHQILLCEQHKTITEKDLNDLLSWSYGGNLKKRPVTNL